MDYNAPMHWKLIGHQWAVELLQHHLRSGRVRHAYLFSGPRGVGRRTLALRFAQALTCSQPPEPAVPCGECTDCRQWEQGLHPDLALVQAERVGGPIKVDQIREMQRRLALAPYQAPYRVALLLRFEEAHPSAANALLKTLEEPPAHVILLLTAESPEQLLPTITSRCEVIRLRPPTVTETARGLEHLYAVPASDAALAAHLALGRPGLALQLARQPGWREERSRQVETFFHLLGASLMERFAYAEAATRDPHALRATLLLWLSLWRDVLVLAADSPVVIVNADQRAALTRLAQALGWQAAYRLVRQHEQALNRLDIHANLRLTLENLLLHWPHLMWQGQETAPV